MKKALIALGLTLGLFALGCGESTPASGSAAASGAPTATAAALADSDLPVPADFEEEAAKSISPANYKGELEAMEKDADAK